MANTLDGVDSELTSAPPAPPDIWPRVTRDRLELAGLETVFATASIAVPLDLLEAKNQHRYKVLSQSKQAS